MPILSFLRGSLVIDAYFPFFLGGGGVGCTKLCTNLVYKNFGPNLTSLGQPPWGFPHIVRLYI